jgi:hypothetical protein
VISDPILHVQEEVMFAEQDSVLSRCGADLKGVIAFHSAFRQMQ